ncbi:23S rRNA (uracil(1939)-C(5))-methyltransferase RlmD [Alteromonas sp. KUL49]|uniref:23S rRNA (uracil(1939)-C(5))-methyltransferase RlmD n=1 Tax=Alteromonas sp. KUL49 TaxID=2480798 RepID=UPI00102F16DC|nr:23S rRNA (uracil(1939)-C(5))-methyltransferase RlmD [Alteromonas sp. KUL49]TAP38892.1 23S rRNA (uracil(1939)-C(5))-methyltransferase RlmD [Alteromonas sp. KUL49]GEA12329.1 23S rRNA (uracil(1939)-C(5))-methyltransferase RlmD [Alteromonas sp. KUL49]
MVSFYKPAKGKVSAGKSSKSGKGLSGQSVVIDDLDWQGKGVVKGKAMYFVDGALPGEACHVAIDSKKKHTFIGRAKNITQRSEYRVTPFCEYANVCGGCHLQHIGADAALAMREQALKTMLSRTLNIDEECWEPPLSGSRPHYRRKARLAVDARNADKIKIGFRQQQHSAVVDINHCPVLLPELSVLITPLKTLINKNKLAKFIGHIGLLAGEELVQVSVKLTKTPSNQLFSLFKAFAEANAINMVIEHSDGTLDDLYTHGQLTVSIANDLILKPQPNSFVQVNPEVNRKMVEQALDWLAPSVDDYIADWFCGLGNFTLPIASTGARVQAVEGVADMVVLGEKNALEQGIKNIEWHHTDLADTDSVTQMLHQSFDKVLLDPSREGALTVCHVLCEAKTPLVVYISCNPSTFTRDAKVLIDGGYRVKSIKAVEMFPFTHHMEMMALFTR